jgi:hypothetical protein
MSSRRRHGQVRKSLHPVKGFDVFSQDCRSTTTKNFRSTSDISFFTLWNMNLSREEVENPFRRSFN